MSNITTPDKNIGDPHYHTDYNAMKAAINSKSDAPYGVAYTTAIPFTNINTIIDAHTVSANTVITKVTSGAVGGYGASLLLTADGNHTVDLSAFKKIGSGAWVNTNGTINLLLFYYDGTNYNVCISQPTPISAPGGNVAPVASGVAFTGTQTEGQTLTGTYTYSDADGDAEGASIKKWYRSDNSSGLNRAAISGATNSTYVLQSADVGKYIQFAATPVAAAGTTTGTEVFSAYSSAIAAVGGTPMPTPLTLLSASSGSTESPTGTFNIPDAGNIVFNETITVGQWAYATIPSSNREVSAIGVDGDNTLEYYATGSTQNWLAYVFLYNGTYQINGSAKSGTAIIDTGVAYATGDKFGVRLADVSGHIRAIACYDRGSGIVDLLPSTFTTDTPSTVYIKAASALAGTTLVNPSRATV